MKDVKCGLKECKYNKGYCCCSNNICIDGRTDCSTYEPDERKRRATFEAASDFMPKNYSEDTEVSCTADCIYNKGGKCTSHGITVMSSEHEQAACLTYVKS